MASPPCLSAPLTPFLTQNLPPIGFFIRWDIIVGTKGFACMFKLWRRKAVSRSWWCPPACPPRRRSQTGPGSSQTCCLRCRSTEKKKNCYSKKLNFHSESFGELMTNENIPGLWDPIRNDWLRGREDCQYCSDCSGKEGTRPEEMANRKSPANGKQKVSGSPASRIHHFLGPGGNNGVEVLGLLKWMTLLTNTDAGVAAERLLCILG